MVARIVLVVILLIAGQGCSSPPVATHATVDIHGETFQLELIVDHQSRVEGMMHRTNIRPSGGMLFVFPNAIERSFWMKNCFVDIDLIFLDSRGTVTAVHGMVLEAAQGDDESLWTYEGRLQHYWSHGPARFAIEVASGTINRLGVRVNDQLSLDVPYLKSIAR